MIPESTSPVPAEASQGPPVVLTAIRPDPGSAMTVAEPFRSTTASVASASRRAAGNSVVTGRFAHETGELAVMRGQHRGGLEHRVADPQRREIAPQRVQPVGVQHQGHGGVGHELDHRGLGPLVPPQAGTDDERAEPVEVPQHRARGPRVERALRRRGQRDGDDLAPGAAAAAASPGTPHHTIPAPVRSTARLTSVGAPVMPRVPPTTITPPTSHLWVFGRRGGSHAATSAASVSPAGDAPTSMPMSATVTTPGVRATWFEEQTRLARRERHRAIGPHRDSVDRAVQPVHPGGDVDRDDRAPGARRPWSRPTPRHLRAHP